MQKVIMKKTVKCVALGLLAGCALATLFYFFATFGECYECFCACDCINGDYYARYGDFWSWDSYFEYLIVLSSLCSLLGLIFGLASEDSPEIKIRIPIRVVAIVFLVGLFILTKFILGCIGFLC